MNFKIAFIAFSAVSVFFAGCGGENDPDAVKTLVENMADIEGVKYKVAKYEVTQGLWKCVMGDNPSHFQGDLSLPVENVSLGDCQKFVAKLNAHRDARNSGLTFRIPTEEEWRTACRGASDESFGELDDGEKGSAVKMAWYAGNSTRKTHPVGMLRANTYGIYDMHGNVGEWTVTEKDGMAVVCGGCWFDSADSCTTDSTYSTGASHRNSDVGLRLFADVTE